ncbi:MAG: AmmeMemoRadiSam system protein B [Patescibacteria group bacterium]
MKEKIIIAVVFILAIGVGLFGYFYAGKSERISEKTGEAKQAGVNFPISNFHKSYSSDLDLYENFFKQATSTEKTGEQAISGVIPHHLVAGKYIANFVKGLSDQHPQTIVLIGPNHLQRGPDQIVSGVYDWQTPYGVLKTDEKIIKNLSTAGVVKINDDIIDGEWSISSDVPFLKRIWPDAKIIPIILKNDINKSELDNLSDQLIKYLPKNSIVLASVDFSHYLPKEVANFHDDLSINTLASGNISQVDKLEIDSQSSLYLLMKYNQLKGVEKFNLVSHTNSADIVGQPDLQETTSHVIGYFSPGQATEKPEVALQFFGDIMLDRNVAKAMATSGLDYIFAKLKAQENRFFWGTDLMGANLEGPFAPARIKTSKSIAFRFDPLLAPQLKNYGFGLLDLANNHAIDMGWSNLDFTKTVLSAAGLNYFGDELREGPEYSWIGDVGGYKIAFIGLNNTDHTLNLSEVEKAMVEAKKSADYVIIDTHWGVEYKDHSNENQQYLAHWLIDKGADAVIGGHPHVVEEMEMYKDKPIFYSLGNFIFDQYFSPETQEGISVGLIFGENGVKKVYVFPFYSQKSQPQLMNGQQRADFMKKFNFPNI